MIIAIIFPGFKRRTMFLTGAIGMLCVYIAWLVAVQRTVTALNAGTTNKSAAVAALFFIYFYSSWYNIGNNALAYSKSNFCFQHPDADSTSSIHSRDIPLCGEITRYLH
jgi:hypothetical protein